MAADVEYRLVGVRDPGAADECVLLVHRTGRVVWVVLESKGGDVMRVSLADDDARVCLLKRIGRAFVRIY